jgi:hypothetical protein
VSCSVDSFNFLVEGSLGCVQAHLGIVEFLKEGDLESGDSLEISASRVVSVTCAVSMRTSLGRLREGFGAVESANNVGVMFRSLFDISWGFRACIALS